MGDDNDHDARTIHCGNLMPEKITEELLYELFLQAGPLERVAIPKDGDKNRPYGFVTYKYQESVPYALSVFSGTKLFNRELRLNNRNVNKNAGNNNNNRDINSNSGNNPFRGQASMEPQPILPNASLAHQFQMQNPLGNAALRGGNQHRGSAMNPMNNMMPKQNNAPLAFPQNSQIDFQTLLAYGAQMMATASGLAMNNMGNDNNESHKHQSKMMSRHERRPHNQNSNYSRDRNDRRRDRSRDRSRDRNDRNDWMRNSRDNNRSDRRNQRGNDNNRRR